MGAPELVLEFDLVDLEIAADQDGRELLVCLEDQGLDQVGGGDAEEGGDFVDTAHRRGMDGFRLFGGRQRPRRGLGNRSGDRLFDVGAVVAGGAREDGILTGVREHHELVRLGAADVAGVGLDLGVAEPAPFEDAAVGCLHGPVGQVEVFGIGVEGVGVLHDELAPAHEPETRPDLVPELGLDLEEVDRELSVGGDGSPHDVGDDLFVGRTETELAVVAVVDPQQFGPILEPPSGLLPELGRLDCGEDQFSGPGALHLLTDDDLELGQ